MLLFHTPVIVTKYWGWLVYHFVHLCSWGGGGGGNKVEARVSEIVLLFHAPPIVKVLGKVGLLFSLLSCLPKNAKSLKPLLGAEVRRG